MGIRDAIAKAHRAQQEHDHRIPVQLEIQEEPRTLWASYEEYLQWWRNEYLSESELQMLRDDMAAHPQDY